MTERKGLFTPQQEDFLAKLLDEIVKFKNPFLEMVDGMVFKVLIQTADNQGLDKIPEEYKADLRSLIDAAMAEKWEEVRRLFTDVLVKHANFFKNAEASLLFFDGVTKLIMSAIDWYVQKKQAENPA
jgi:hypothetical protein